MLIKIFKRQLCWNMDPFKYCMLFLQLLKTVIKIWVIFSNGDVLEVLQYFKNPRVVMCVKLWYIKFSLKRMTCKPTKRKWQVVAVHVSLYSLAIFSRVWCVCVVRSSSQTRAPTSHFHPQFSLFPFSIQNINLFPKFGTFLLIKL